MPLEKKRQTTEQSVAAKVFKPGAASWVFSRSGVDMFFSNVDRKLAD